MVDRIMVPFHGDGDGVEELTWAQIGLWQGMVVTGRSVTMAGSAPLPPGTTVEQIADLLGYVVGRHQALRTRLRLRNDGLPLQVCVSAGTVPLEIVDAADPTSAAREVESRYRETNFDYEHEFPVRMAVIRHNGRVVHMVAVYLHTALDAGGLEALLADIFSRDPATGTGKPVIAIEPMEQARKQRSPAARRQSAASMAYLEHALRTMHPSQFGEPRHENRGIRMIRYRSPATALAVPRIAAQEGMNTSSVLLAVFAVGLARMLGHGRIMAMLMVGNRFRPGFADSVSPLVQLSPYLIDVGGVSLSDAAGRARTSVLNAYKNAYYDPYEQEAVIDRVRADRGDIDYSCIYNDRRRSDRDTPDQRLSTAEEIRAALLQAEHNWEYRPDMSSRHLFLTVEDAPDAIDFVMTADTRYFTDDDIIAITAEFENVAAQTATEPTLATGVETPAAVTTGRPA